MIRQFGFFAPLRVKILCLIALFLLALAVFFSLFARQAFPKQEKAIFPIVDSTVTLMPKAELPSEGVCATRVRHSAWEPRPNNIAANYRVPTSQQIAELVPWGSAIGLDSKADTFRKQITGNFTGTTDEIFQWVACKWGISLDIIRAEAVTESDWYQSQQGDWTTDETLCPPDTWNGTGCYQSYGVLQIKYVYNKTAWPMSRDNTAFNVEYAYARIRACYEGWTTYLYDRIPLAGYPHYHAGDLWGCIGMWYSGSWYDQGGIDYINSVKAHLADKKWLASDF